MLKGYHHRPVLSGEFPDLHKLDPSMKIVLIAALHRHAVFDPADAIGLLIAVVLLIVFAVPAVRHPCCKMIFKSMKPIIPIISNHRAAQYVLYRRAKCLAQWWIFQHYQRRASTARR